MSALVIAGVAAGGALGALARDQLDRALTARFSADPMPWGILAVNVLGSLGLGVLLGGGWNQDALLVLGTGFLGGFTTFSTFAVQLVSLPRRDATRYGGVSVGLCWLAVLLGAALADLG